MHCTAGRRPSTSDTLSRTFVSLGRNIAAWIDDQTSNGRCKQTSSASANSSCMISTTRASSRCFLSGRCSRLDLISNR